MLKLEIAALMPSQTIENYLKAMHNLAGESGEVSVTELAHQMQVSLPTVNSMVKKLAELGWVLYAKYKPLRITDSGKREAALIIRRHRLTEMYLVEKMGFGWEEVHHIAEQIEHIKSPLLFDRMDKLLGYPVRDPHGSPIPDKEGNMATLELRRLADCQAQEEVVLKGLEHSSDAFLKYLNSKDLALGTTIRILEVEPFDQAMTIAYGKHKKEVLSEKVCTQLLVSL